VLLQVAKTLFRTRYRLLPLVPVAYCSETEQYPDIIDILNRQLISVQRWQTMARIVHSRQATRDYECGTATARRRSYAI